MINSRRVGIYLFILKENMVVSLINLNYQVHAEFVSFMTTLPESDHGNFQSRRRMFAKDLTCRPTHLEIERVILVVSKILVGRHTTFNLPESILNSRPLNQITLPLV